MTAEESHDLSELGRAMAGDPAFSHDDVIALLDRIKRQFTQDPAKARKALNGARSDMAQGNLARAHENGTEAIARRAREIVAAGQVSPDEMFAEVDRLKALLATDPEQFWNEVRKDRASDSIS